MVTKAQAEQQAVRRRKGIGRLVQQELTKKKKDQKRIKMLRRAKKSVRVVKFKNTYLVRGA